MSHCPGLTLEDYLTDAYGIIDFEHGDPIRRLYAGQRVLNQEQFAPLVKIYEPVREYIEDRLSDYDEEDHGSWRDYSSYFDTPKEIDDEAEAYLKSLEGQVEITKPFLEREVANT